MITSLMDMKNVIFSETYATITDMTVASLSFSHQSITGSFLSQNLFKEVDFTDCAFFSTTILKTKFIGCKFKNCNFGFSKIENCNFISCTFENCTFTLTNSLNNNYHSCTFFNTAWKQGISRENDLFNCQFNDFNTIFTKDESNKLDFCFFPVIENELMAA